MVSISRIRVNAKQTSKGEYYFDCTAELPGEDPDKTAQFCLDAVRAMEKKFINAGKKIVVPEK